MMLATILYILVLLTEPHIPRNPAGSGTGIGHRVRYEAGYSPYEYVVDEPWIWRDE